MRWWAGALALALSGGVFAESLRGVRFLALSPDGTQLAFGWRGDLWVVPATGGEARPITNHIEMDQNPVWSPDGKQIAFNSNRFGSTDIFVVPANGGRVQRVTWHSGADTVTDWPTPDRIVFAARREETFPGLFSINPANGRLDRYTLDPFNISNGRLRGNELLFTRIGFPETRPRYEGTSASQLQILNTSTGERRALRDNRFQHFWPRWMPNGDVVAVTVSEKTPSSRNMNDPGTKFTDNANRTPNVYRIRPNGNAQRLTSFVGGAGVRALTAARDTGLLAFEFNGDAYTMAPGGEPKKIEIAANVDDKTTQEERVEITSGADQGALSPKNDQIAFVARGELWLVPVKQGKGPNARDARRLTTWAGTDEQPLWHPNGESLFFVSDRDGAARLFELNLKTLDARAITPTAFDVSEFKLSPNRKSLHILVDEGPDTLYVLNLEQPGSNPTKLLETNNVGDFAFSPDEKFIAFQRSLRGVSNIWLYEIATQRWTNLTRRNTGNFWPSWSVDGKFLYFRNNQGGLFLIPLQPEDARTTDGELSFKKPEGVPQIKIDLEGITDRIRRLFGQTPDSPVWSDPADGDLFFLSEGDLWRASYNGDNVRRITGGGGIRSFTPAAEGSLFYIQRGDQLQTFAYRQPNAQPQSVPYYADWTRDLRAERRAALQEFYRIYNARFYDGNFHGRDWAAIRDRYIPLLDSVEHRNEMAILLNQMVGELEASHTEVSPAPGNPFAAPTAHPGFTFDYNFTGTGLRIASVPARTPGSFAATRFAPGEIVTKINGRPVTEPNESMYRDILNGQLGRNLTLTVNNRDVTIRSTTNGEFSATIFDNLLNDRRRLVEERTGGKVAYLHISGMGQGNFQTFMEEAWEAVQGKKAVIIDVRNNGGGNISDRLIDMIERIPHSWYVPRGGEIEPAPGQSWNLPTVVMMNETSLSNAEMFPSAMKARRLAVTVGRQTPGYVIWTFGGSLIDGTGIRIPTAGSYRLDGSPIENNGEKPDFDVPMTTQQFFAGAAADPQLAKAIEEALKRT